MPNIVRMIHLVNEKPTDAAWSRLGAIVRARREALKLSQAEVQVAGGPSDVVQSRIENNDSTKPRPRGSTLRMLDGPLQWEQGSAIEVLSGGDPTPIGSRGSIQDATDEDLLAEIRRRMRGERSVVETTPEPAASTQGGQAEEDTGLASDDGYQWPPAPGWPPGDEPGVSSGQHAQND